MTMLERTRGSRRLAYRSWPLFAALLLADIAFAYQQTAVVPSIPAIEDALHASAQWGAWLLSGYLMVACVATPLAGKLADRYGHKRLLLITLAAFVLGSAGAAASPTIAWLVICRSAQGIGGAVFPLTFSLVRDHVSKERVGSAIGLLTGGFGIGTAVGAGSGGLLTATFGWPAVFAVGAAAIGVVTIGVVVAVPAAGEATTNERIDIGGAALLGGALAALLVALTLGPGLGWTDPLVWAIFAGAPAFGWAWLRRELHTREPLIDIRTLRAPPVLWTNLATIALGYVLFGSYYLIPHLVRDGTYGFAATTATIGLYLLPVAIGQLVAGPAAGALGRRFGVKWLFFAGMVGCAGCVVWLAAMAGVGGGATALLVAVFGLGCGVGLAISTTSTLVTTAVAPHEAGVSTALNSTMRRFGGGLGGQLSAAFLVAGGAAPGSYALAFAVAGGLGAVGAATALRVTGRRHAGAASG